AAADFEYTLPEEGPLRLLVTGGSGGARSLNRRLPAAVSGLGDAARGVEVLHQYGEGRREEVAGAYEDFRGDVELTAFIDDMAEAYRRAHLVVCRAGATTIAEVLTFGLPAIYVPSPHVADDHQSDNAREVAESGAGILLDDDQVGSQRATRLIGGLVRNPQSLTNLAGRARQLRREEAADVVAEGCLELTE
ncbi:MAG: glycosyltransferase, partial [Bradymonadaceae bacterium]